MNREIIGEENLTNNGGNTDQRGNALDIEEVAEQIVQAATNSMSTESIDMRRYKNNTQILFIISKTNVHGPELWKYKCFGNFCYSDLCNFKYL